MSRPMEDAQISKKEVADKKHRKPHLKYTKVKTEPKLLSLSVVYCLGLNATSPSDLHLQGNRWGTS